MYRLMKFMSGKTVFCYKNAKIFRAQIYLKYFSTSVDDPLPLSGIRVLDLTRIVAGPYCTMILGDLGAEILKIERPFVGDELRNWGPPFFEGTKETPYFSSINRNKKSICIDLKRGKDIIYELVQSSDVFIENYIPGKLAEMGLDYATLNKIAPGLIYCSITGFGSVGPYATRPGYDIIAAALGGLMHVTGPKDGEPCKVGVPMTDIATGLYAHGAIMAALLQRAKTNRGQWIQCNLLSTQVSAMLNVASNYLNAGLEASRWGTAHISLVPYEAFPTKDGFISVGAGSNAQFSTLLLLMNLPGLENDSKFKTNVDRVKNRTELIQILRNEFKKKTNNEWSQIFKDAPFPNGSINSISQVFDDPHIKDIKLVEEIDHPSIGKMKVVGPAVTYSYAENSVRLPSPVLGQHTTEVLKSLLNYSEEKISRLVDEKIIQ